MSRSSVFAVTATQQFGEALRDTQPYTFQASLWAGSAASWTSLTTPESGGRINAVDTQSQVGVGAAGAMLWRGTVESAVSLHPAGYWHSEATSAAGSRQFGYTNAVAGDLPRAAAWSGSAASYVSMNPPGASQSEIFCAWGGQQGGYARIGAGPRRAGIWSGTAESFVDLNPPGFDGSTIHGMAAGEQVGGGARPGWLLGHAILWRGTPESWTDLDPGWGLSVALATIGGVQAGWAAIASDDVACLWFGTRESFLNLAQFLPPGYHGSQATSIATDGTSYYVGGFALNSASSREAFLWVGPVPAPAGLTLLMLAGGALAWRRRPD
jgi:hypothetical protein